MDNIESNVIDTENQDFCKFRIKDLQSADVALKAQEAVEEEERRLEEAKMDVVQRLSHNSKQYAFNQKVS